MLVIREADRVATLSLEERSDASTALAMHELMIHSDLDNVDFVDMNALEAKKLDATILQLLVAWCNALDSRHIPWRWSGVSEAFAVAVRHAGLGDALRLVNGSSDENPVI